MIIVILVATASCCVVRAVLEVGILGGLRVLPAGVLDDVVADMQASGEDVPEPLSTRHYSGKFQLRVGEDLHRRLAIEAAEQHSSLNQYVVKKLAAAS